MVKKSIYLIYIISTLTAVLIIETVYLVNTKSISDESLNKKNLFVKITSLPDLAIATEATYTRHRSISDIFSIYKDDGSLREYFPTSFTYTYSDHNSNNRIIDDKK